MSQLIVVTMLIALICNILAALLSYLVLSKDSAQPYRIQRKKYSDGTFIKRFPTIAKNLTVLLVLSIIGLWFAEPLFSMRDLSPWLIAGQVFFLMVADDFYFYFFHRALHHSPFLYSRIHKTHHHAFAPFALEYIYVHPLEWILGSLGIPIGLGILWLINGELSTQVFWIFVSIRNLHELEIHSGIKSSITKYIPFYGTTEHHDLHHSRKSDGNFASTFTVWDKVMGTELPAVESQTTEVSP